MRRCKERVIVDHYDVDLNDGKGIQEVIVLVCVDSSFRFEVGSTATILLLWATTMSSNETQVIAARGPKLKKLKPARKQVKPGDVEKKETPQTGKEYSMFRSKLLCLRNILTSP